jgi:hypothetical protein
MAEQNKNGGTAQGGTTSNPGSTENKTTGSTVQQREQDGAKSPNHEQGREHIPNVNAQREAADERRTAEQAHAPNATSRGAEDHSSNANDRKEHQAGDAKRTTAEAQHDQKAGNDSGKIVAGSESNAKS